MNNQQLQSITTEQFFYFFLRLRKGEVRRTVQTLKTRYPDESPQQLAKRLIVAKSRLTFLGGALLNVPLLWPGAGQALKLAGVVGATSMLTRMNLYLILEVANVFGKDIDDRARVAEMAAVVALSGLTSAAPMLLSNLQLNPMIGVPVGAVSASTLTRLIGSSATTFYQREMLAQEPTGEPIPAAAGAPA